MSFGVGHASLCLIQKGGVTMRILSLDGGGIRGAFTASVLATLEQATGRRAIDHFDLITGTSTGGILAIGLAMGFPAASLRDFYVEHGKAIFPTTMWARRFGWLRQIFAPKHSQAGLRESLKSILGDRRLGEAQTRLAIPTYDAEQGRIFIMKTAHHSRFLFDINALAIDVALATSAAPTYFQAANFPEHAGCGYVDGGVWANCPALVGVVEASAFLNAPLEEIRVLSIGTTRTLFNIAGHMRSGIAQWNAGLIELLFEAQAETARAQAGLLAKGGFHRIDSIAMDGQFCLDNATDESIRQLVNLGRGEGAKKANVERVAELFLNGQHVEKFVPCVKMREE